MAKKRYITASAAIAPWYAIVMFSRRRSDRPTSEAPLMQAVEIVGPGPQGRLQTTRLPIPTPGPQEIRIKVSYAGLNRADLLQVQGNYAPPEGASPLPGLEVSGTIDALGEGVVGWNLGEQVCALLSGGGYAEYVVAPASQVLSIPGRLGLKEAATLPEAATTAVMALSAEARIKPYERILVHGASSGTGIMIAQIARAWGAQVYGTAGGPQKTAFLRDFSITPIDHKTSPVLDQLMALTANEGIDIVIDILGAPYLQAHLKMLRPRGRIVSLAMMEGALAHDLKLGGLLMKQLVVRGATLRNRTESEKAELVSAVHKHVWPHISTGIIRPHIDSVFALADAEKAHARMQERLHCGKILLEVAPE